MQENRQERGWEAGRRGDMDLWALITDTRVMLITDMDWAFTIKAPRLGLYMHIFTSFPQHFYTSDMTMKRKLVSRNKSLDFQVRQWQRWTFNLDCAGTSLKAGILKSDGVSSSTYEP